MTNAKKHILIVDDEKELADMLGYLLEAEGYKTTTAYSGHDLLERLQSQTPDLILLDLMMPAYNGLEVMTTLQGMPRAKLIPIYLMSASKEPKVTPKSWSKFISKPFDLESILQKINSAFNERAASEL